MARTVQLLRHGAYCLITLSNNDNDNVLAKKDSLNPVTVINDDSIYRIGKNFFKHKRLIPSGIFIK